MMKSQSIPTLQESRERFATFGECLHYHQEWVKPYGTKTQIKTCMVCAKTFEKKYPTQAQIVKDALMRALEQPNATKESVYTFAANDTSAPRPTIRRVASALRVELQCHLDTLNGVVP